MIQHAEGNYYDPLVWIEATPRPWKHEQANCFSEFIMSQNFNEDEGIGSIVAKTTDGGSEAIANAELIVRAVNSHDELLAACKDAYSELNQLAFIHKDRLTRETAERLQQAITNAEKGE